LKRSIALAVVKGGLNKMGESVVIPLANGKRITAKISSPVFYDTEGVRQHVE
ncbi:MAG TPA: glycine cleavage T C-terminal barrel domain-containing protein, partial [Burkholderia sp.]|nr:glycine cleavage T C-terminal barrel domain-containing protein [Burkholderia sp.]